MSMYIFRTIRMLAIPLIFVSCVAQQRVARDLQTQPNILFLFSDDQQHDAIRALGNEHIITPNLDRLVDRGYAFRQTYCMGSNSGAVCGPSRAMLMTGRTLFRALSNGSYSTLPDVPLWPEIFRRSGYRTFVTGKWHNGRAAFRRSFTDGGAIFFGGMHSYDTGGHHEPRVRDFSQSGEYGDPPQKVKTFSSELFADATIQFLRSRKQAEPFFAYVSFTAPHDPHHAPQEYVDLYKDIEIPLPRNFMPQHPFDNGELKIRDELLAPFPRTPEVIREHLLQYYAMITHLDAQIGRILTVLDELELRENTIIIFSSDHGLAVGQHGLLGKQNLYEHSMRAPLIFSGPGIPRGEASDAFAYLLDIYPTMCELAKLPIPTTVDGHSLVPVMRGQKESVRDSVVLMYKGFQQAIRNKRYKLIRYQVNSVETMQLFDLQEDPLEINNLIDEPSIKKVKADLLDLMRTRVNKINESRP